MAAEEGSDFVTVATDSHGTPASAVRAGIVVEEQAAGRIGATADGGTGTFDEKFGGGAGNRGEKPFESAFAGDIVQGPGPLARNQFVMTFGDAKDFIDGLDPGGGERFAVHYGSENGAKRLAQAKNAQEHSVHSMVFRVKKGAQTSRAILRDQAGVHKEGYKLVPRKVLGGRRSVGEVESEAAGDKRERVGAHKKWGRSRNA